MTKGDPMSCSERAQIVRSRRRWRRRVAATTLALGVSFAASALAAGTTLTVNSASNSTAGARIVVTAHGRTLYVLSPETASHLLCRSSECLKLWPPLTVHSAKTKVVAGRGVHGHLGILRRSNGLLQVTLRGLPLYRYAGDEAKGETNGESIHSFGGIWHVVRAAGGAPASKAPASGNATTPAPTPGY
jgi:predicted lipoprotein with Yx(FWY)xxD motif